MAIFSEFVVDGVQGDVYDKTAVHNDEFEGVLDNSVDAGVVSLFESLGVDFDEE